MIKNKIIESVYAFCNKICIQEWNRGRQENNYMDMWPNKARKYNLQSKENKVVMSWTNKNIVNNHEGCWTEGQKIQMWSSARWRNNLIKYYHTINWTQVAGGWWEKHMLSNSQISAFPYGDKIFLSCCYSAINNMEAYSFLKYIINNRRKYRIPNKNKLLFSR